MVDFLIFFGFVLLCLGLGVFLVVKRGLEMKKLAQEGVNGRAQIIEKQRLRRKGSDAPSLTYEFQDPFGQSRKRRIHVPESVYAQHEVGSSLDIVYLAERPQVNGPKYLVDAVRKM